MKTRILTSVVMAVVGIPILIFSKYIVFPILLSILALAAVFEMFRVLGFDKNYFLSSGSPYSRFIVSIDTTHFAIV